VGKKEPMDGALGRFYDAIENPRRTRNELPILRGDALRRYMSDVRERTLEVLDEIELEDTDDRLLRDGFVYELILAHEQQHNETMLQLLQMMQSYEPAEPGLRGCEQNARGLTHQTSLIEGGEYEIGAGPHGFAYDNERPRHTVELEPFEIDRTPVTNGDYAQFVADTGAEPPLYWHRADDGGWMRTAMGATQPVNPTLPVVHVDHAAAEAFAAWAGKRLPTEFEWEVAAQRGELELVGSVWEWTASDFKAYPGFEAFPYREYSEPFFGSGHKVLRGGSWATRRALLRTTFRNWDLPERRQIFSGLRCVRDV
jgi:gamma-glutamyl hercynylcysteine S-oxide synthase